MNLSEADTVNIKTQIHENEEGSLSSKLEYSYIHCYTACRFYGREKHI